MPKLPYCAGVVIRDVVCDDKDRPAIIVEKSENGIHDLQGTIDVTNPHGARAELGLDPTDVTLSVRETSFASGVD